MKFDNQIFNQKEKVIDFINSLNGFNGYVQFSDRKILQKDIFDKQNLHVDNEEGFVYEAHFCDDKNSLCIRQINNLWCMSVSDISQIDKKDIQIYKAKFDKKVKMAQIWESKEDEMCENFRVKRLQKVVFAGFAE